MPVATARSASARVIAGPTVMSAVPSRILARTSRPPRTGSAPTSGIGEATPASTTTTRTTGPAAEDVDRGPAGHEVGDHLGGDVGRIGRHPLAHDPVVRGGDDDDAALDGRIGPAGDPGELDHQRLELAEAARRLGQAVEPRGGLGHRTRVERSDRVEDAVERSLVGGGLLGDRRPAGHVGWPLEADRQAGHEQVRPRPPGPRCAGGRCRRGRGRRGRRRASARSRSRPRR